MFKDIKGYEGLYQISDRGSVKSTPSDGKPNRMLKQEIIKKENTNYRRVSLSKNGIVSRFSVHRLVGMAFIDNPNNKKYINHIDNDGENNWKDNLEWCTHSENMIHAQKQGRLFKSQSKGGKNAGIAGEKRIRDTEAIVTVLKWFQKEDNNRWYIECIPKCGHGTMIVRNDRVNTYPNCIKCNEISKYEKTIQKYKDKIIKLKKELI